MGEEVGMIEPGAVLERILAALSEGTLYIRMGKADAKDTVTEGPRNDIVLVIAGFDSRDVRLYIDHAVMLLNDGIDGIKFTLIEVRDSVNGMKVRASAGPKVVFAGPDQYLDLDIIFMPDPTEMRAPQAGIAPDQQYLSTFQSPEQAAYIQQQETFFPALHNVAVECKRLIYEDVSDQVPTYFIQLLCIKEFQERYDAKDKGVVTATDVLLHQVYEQGVYTCECPVSEEVVTCPMKFRQSLCKETRNYQRSQLHFRTILGRPRLDAH